ncbi:hypothetical protein C8J56DRAFT_962573 [Mycena floridula]|nr:hypothetical protein C8J56DRAFT_962573 [Mycena floridula]
MPSCSICIDDLKSPVALPCGHIFCHACICRAINAIKPILPLQHCPSCRAVYTIVNVDPSLFPPHLRPHLQPSIRRLYLDSEPIVANMERFTTQRAVVAECGRLKAENDAMRINCDLWRKRAELHAAATMGLLGLARSAKEQAMKMKLERDRLEHQLLVLMQQRRNPEQPDSASQTSEKRPIDDDEIELEPPSKRKKTETRQIVPKLEIHDIEISVLESHPPLRRATRRSLRTIS